MSQEYFAAAQSGDTAQIKTLLEAGADHAAVDEAGETALMHAAHAGHVAAVQLLIAAGADVNAKSPQGWTALAKAAYNSETERGDVEVMEWLINTGADVLAANEGGRTARMMADDKFYVDVINLLHEAEQQLGVSVDVSCSSTRGVAKPQVVNLMKPTTH